MVIAVRNSASSEVNLIQFTKDEVDALRLRAINITRGISASLNKLRQFRPPESKPLLWDLSSEYAGMMTVNPHMLRPSELRHLTKVRNALDASGLTRDELFYSSHDIFTTKELTKRITSVLLGKEVMKQIVLAGNPSGREELISREIHQRGQFLDAWTESIAKMDPDFDARQMFADKTRLSLELYSSAAVFIPSHMHGVAVALSGSRPGKMRLENSYQFDYGFAFPEFDLPDGNRLTVELDLYTIDTRLLDAMMKYGGKKLRDDLLRSYETAALLASHAYMHGSVRLDSQRRDSVLHAVNMSKPLLEESNKIGTIRDLEHHALRSHKQAFQTIKRRMPGMEEAFARQAVHFCSLLQDWEERMAKRQEAHGMTSFMAQQEFERLVTHFDVNEPFFLMTAKNDRGEPERVADAFARFAPPGRSSQPLLSGIVRKDNPLRNNARFVAFLCEFIREQQHAIQLEIHQTDKVSYGGLMAEPALASSNYRKALATLADGPDHPLADMKQRHALAQKRLLAERARIDGRKDSLQLTRLIKEGGLLDRMESALKGTPQAQAFAGAAASFRKAAARALRAVETKGVERYPLDRHDGAQRHWRIVEEFPAAIDALMQAAQRLPQAGAQAKNLSRTLRETKAAWEQITQGAQPVPPGPAR